MLLGIRTAFFVALLVLGLENKAMAAAAPATLSDAAIVHFLNRVSFGPTGGDVDRVKQLGFEEYLNQQLEPGRLIDPDLLKQKINELPTLSASMADLAATYEPGHEKDMGEAERKEVEKNKRRIVEELSEAKILRAVLSPAQLQEVMTDFWFNHFNVFVGKGADKILISAYERDAIRPYALGKFRDLLGATAHHPAMLFYLDNWMNTDPESRFARGKKLGINENYAREIMELHTLGVNGGYTQSDVTALAHILTGWGLSPGRTPAERTAFYFDARRHDDSNIDWLGERIRGGGQEEIEFALDRLAHHPATAKHIATQLAEYFVSDNPPPRLVDDLAKAYTESDGDIAAILRELFHSPEFWDPKNTQNKFKPPLRYVVSTLRAASLVPNDTKKLQGAIANMGEPLYHCLTPNGYANTNDQWLNSDALLKRINFARTVSGLSDLATSQYIESALHGTFENNTLSAVVAAEPRLKTGLLLASPEFLYY